LGEVLRGALATRGSNPPSPVGTVYRFEQG
jgi:hypothetical protein